MANTVLSDIPLMSDAQQGRKAAMQAANTLGSLIQAGGQLPKDLPGSSKGFILGEGLPPCAPEAGRKNWKRRVC